MSRRFRRPRTAAERERAAAARTAQVEEATGRIDEQVRAIRGQDEWKQFLRTAAKFTDYSFGNILLIGAQRPDATLVAGYRAWQNDHDRQVRKGERGLKILAPLRRMVPVTDEAGEPVRDDDGKEVKAPKVQGWTTATVFDISQTDGPDLPSPPMPASLHGDAPVGMWDALAVAAREAGFTVEVGQPRDGSALGVTYWKSREIIIDATLSPASQAATLAHELGHVVLHEPGASDITSTARGGRGCRGEREVEAESVAFILSEQWGLDTTEQAMPYIAGWAQSTPDPDEAVRAAGQRIVKASTVLTAATRDQDFTDLRTRAAASAVSASTARAKAEQAGPPPDRLREVVAAAWDFYSEPTRVNESWVPTMLSERSLHNEDGAVGFAPAGWTALCDHLRDQGFIDTEMIAAGVARRAKYGLIDQMRDRAITPLYDGEGAAIAFVGRRNPARDADDEATQRKVGPKYLNTPETTLYEKGSTVYGRDQLTAESVPVLVEGPMDALAVTQASRAVNANYVGVATCGTAITSAHVDAVTIHRNTIVAAFDNDTAGQVADDRLHEVAGPRPVTLNHAQFVGDPNDELQTHGADALVQALADSHRTPLGAVLVDRTIGRYNPDHIAADVNVQVAAAREVAGIIARDTDDQRRADLLTRAAARFQIAWDALGNSAAPAPLSGPELYDLVDAATQRRTQAGDRRADLERAGGLPVTAHDHAMTGIARQGVARATVSVPDQPAAQAEPRHQPSRQR